MEVSGFTLEEIAARDPAWIAAPRALIAQGRIELIGSGYQPDDRAPGAGAGDGRESAPGQ